MARFSHIAGDPVLDLVNTVEWRLSDELREEDLTTFTDVLDWCVESGLLSEEERASLQDCSPATAEKERVAVIALREALYATLFADDADGAAVLAQEHREALAHSRLVLLDGSWTWRDTTLIPATPRHRIARAAMALLARNDLHLLHQCEDADCGWVYLDTSRSHNRRWCVTKDCGDRNRARAYYARKKQAGTN